MTIRRIFFVFALVGALAACGGDAAVNRELAAERQQRDARVTSDESFFDLFRNRGNPEIGIQVNRYLWVASLDTLNFLPLEAVDPFSGVIITDWGRVNGGAYRVTVYINDPALDAASLKVSAFRQQGGRAVAVGEAENRRLENAILTRARQLRIASVGG